MIEHTYNKPQYASIFGRTVVFMARPGLTRQKKYREPIVIKKKRFANKAEAEQAAKQWTDGVLV